MTKGFVSIAQIIERVYINAGYEVVNWNEALEHTGSLISLLGISSNYVDRITDGSSEKAFPIVIQNYRGQLPDDIIYIVQCREFKSKYPMVESFDSFHLNPSIGKNQDIFIIPTDYTSFKQTEIDALTPDPNILYTQEELAQFEKSRSMFFNYKTTHEIETINYHAEIFAGSNFNAATQLNYKIENSTIFTNFKEGLVEIAYKAFPTDDNGFPLIRDDEKVIRAIEKGLIERIDYKLWRRGQLPDKIYQHSSRERDWAIAAAKSNAAQPTLAGMESLKNMLLRLIPDVNMFKDGFKSSTEQERMYNR